MTSGIYMIVFSNGRYYIGSSKNVEKRRCHHLHSLRNGCHYNTLLQRTWNKHGEGEFLVLENVDEKRELLLTREQVYLDAAPKGALLNLSRVAEYPEGTPSVVAGRSARARTQHANGNLGPHTITPEGKARIAAANSKRLKGRRQKPEAVAKMRKACRERWTPELRAEQRQRLLDQRSQRTTEQDNAIREKQKNSWTSEKRANQRERFFAQRAEGRI